MIIIPQFYLKNGKVVILDAKTSPLFHDDPIATARTMKDAGAEAIHVIDPGIPPVGLSPHLPIIKKIKDELGLALYADGSFKTSSSVESFIAAGAELVLLGNQAYQQPAFLNEVCMKLPGKIGVHVDVKNNRVTIPGYAVVSNKTALDYAEQFLASGVRHIFYSNVGANGLANEEHFKALLEFCKHVAARVFCTTEISEFSDIEKIVKLNAPKLDGLILAKSIYEGRIELKSAIALANDLMISREGEETIAEV